MFYVPGLIFGDTKGVRTRFHVLHSPTRFRLYRGRQVPFSCLCSRTRFRRYRGRRVPFSCLARPESILTVLSASGSVFMFYAPELIFGCTEGVGTHFHVLRSRTHFRLYRGLPVPFSCFARLESFSAVMRASGPVFIFCAPGLIFGSVECVGSCFHVLRARTCFRRYRGRLILFSYFACPDSFSAVLRTSGPVFMFCALGLIFGGTECVGFSFHVLRSRTRFRRYRGRQVPFSSFALPD
jgi:hypothetical protein